MRGPNSLPSHRERELLQARNSLRAELDRELPPEPLHVRLITSIIYHVRYTDTFSLPNLRWLYRSLGVLLGAVLLLNFFVAEYNVGLVWRILLSIGFLSVVVLALLEARDD